MWRATVRKNVLLKLNDAAYNGYIKSTILYGSEVWCLKVGYKFWKGQG